jgi:hypothetical protein
LKKLTSGVGVLYSLFLASLILIYIFQLTLLKALMWGCNKAFRAAFKGTKYVKTKEEQDEAEKIRLDDMSKKGIDVFSDDLLVDLKMGPLKDYYKKAF